MPSTMPRVQRHENIRQIILKTALSQIHSQGVAQLSLRELARRTGYSPASLYEYFDGKDEIVATLQDEGLQRLNEYLARVPGDLPVPQRLVEMGLAYLEFAGRQPKYFELIFSQLPSRRRSLREVADAGLPFGLVLQTMSEGLADGSLTLTPAVDAEGAAYSLWAFVHGLAVLQAGHLKQFEADFATLHRHALELFVASLFR